MDDDNKDSSSTNESETTECHFERGTHSVNITGQGFEPRKSLLDSPHALNGLASSLNNGRNSPIPPSAFPSFRDHIKSKASLAETFMKNISRNNNNTLTTNYNHVPTNSNSIGETLNQDNFNILQASSKKHLMDSARKQHKYLAKRKILMHYNEELNEKRLKEYERYGMEQHDANNNPEVTIQESQAGPVAIPQSHNNFKIRLMENHLKANQQQQQQEQQQQKQMEMEQNNDNGSSNNNNNHSSNHHHHHHNDGNEDEEEALNLVQNNSHDHYHKQSSDTLAKRPSESSDSVMETEHMDVDQTSESDVASITNVDVPPPPPTHLHDEDDINNNNTTKQEIVELDDNNNSNLKNLALINAINRNVEHSKKLDYQRHTGGEQSAPPTTVTPPQAATPTPQTADSPQHQHAHHQQQHHHTDDSEEDNNNNHLQLDLSAVKSIATAEILCGLKSKVFKMEALDANESSTPTLERQQTNRTLNEIKNAD